MSTRFNFKIHTVILISLAFLFRLLFINISLLPSSNASKAGKLAISYTSKVPKKRRSTSEVAAKSDCDTYSTVEVCEESTDNEEDLTRANSPAILSILFSFLKHIVFIPKLNSPFDLIKCDLYPKKYLALSMLRI